jgi:DNA mismatch endonuclease (patch repair protein)
MSENPEIRSKIMRAVKSKDTTPEMAVRRIVYHSGYRYRLHYIDLPGKPDLVFKSRKKVIFVHGCFWHGHKCKRGNRIPKNNRSYWVAKIKKNHDRDVANKKSLKSLGYDVLTVWECQLKETEVVKRKIIHFLESS